MKNLYNSIYKKFNYSFLFILLLLTSLQSKAQYCNTGLGGAGCGVDQITGVEIIGTTLVNPNDTCIVTFTNTLTVFPDSANTTANLMQGVTYSISITTGADNIISVWLDYNQDFNFDASEWTQVCTTSVAGGTTTVQITIPFSALVGTTGLRIRSRGVNNTNGASDACTNFGSGETEDYTIHIVAAPPCTGTPVAGTANAGSAVCPNVPFNLSLTGNTQAGGLSYQWESSPDSIVWTAISGAVSNFYTATQLNNTYYHCIVTCAGQADTSSVVLVTTNSFVNCYCTSFSNNTVDDDIGNVTFAGLNNGVGTPALNNSSSVNTYSDFTALPPTVLLQGLNYPIEVTQINSSGNFYACYLTVYIDYNHDGVFDITNELIFDGETNSAVGGNILSGTVTIPVASTPGITRMRVLLQEAGNVGQPSCGSYGYGETEDYLVNIQAASLCVAPPTAGTAIASASNVCPAVPFTLNLTGSTIASGLTYQWQSSATTSNFANISGATSINYSTTQSSNTYYRCVVTCSGVSDTSTNVLVNVNSFVNCYCTSSATSTGDDDIGNVTFGSINNGVGSPATLNSTSINTYTNFSNLPTQTFLKTISYPLSITQINLNGFYVCSIVVFIDYNQNGVFDPQTETVFSGNTTAGSGGNTITGNVTIPAAALSGNTLMRVVLVEGTTNPTPCGTYLWGETEDYTINIQPAIPCVAPPTAGVAISSVANVCPGINFNLNLSGSTIAAGLSYQWQVSSNNINFTNISGATAINYTTSQTSNSYYRCLVFCTGVPDSSSSVYVTTNSFVSCYCTSAANSTVDDDIGNFSLGSLNNGVGSPALSNATSVNTYTDFSSLPPTILLQGLSYPISMTQINSSAFFYSCYLTVYIDYNHDGIFDINNELIFDGQTIAGQGGNLLTGNITIPLTSLPGVTTLRAVLRENGSITQSPCGGYGYGETEDYLVDIIPAPPCVAPPAAGTAMASDSTVCPNINFNLSLMGSALASGLSYQWESSTDNVNWTSIPGATTLYYQTSQTVSTYYRCNVFCTAVSSTSTSLFVSLNSFVDCYCTSFATSDQGADIGNVTIGQINNGIAVPVTNNPLALNTYSDFSYLGASNFTKNIYYTIKVSQISSNTLAACRMAAFIDYDHDGIFDPSGEIVFGGQTPNGLLNNLVIDSINIPSTALTGVTKMRLVLEQGTSIPDPCGSYFTGETEDYLINILNDSPCSLPFTVGATASSVPSVCSADIFALSLPSLLPDTGYSFQWQSSSNNTLWTNIQGATNQFYNGSENFPTYYRCIVACSAGTDTIASTPIFVDKKPLSDCSYCNSNINGNCGVNYYIDSVAIGGTTLNNANSGCAANSGFAFSKYPANGNTTTTLGQGNYYDIFVKTAGSCNLSVWVDYDQSGTFDAKEWIQISAATDSAVTTTIPLVIPDTVTLGVTGMRIRSRKAGNQNLASDACSTYGSGETEDYYVTLVAAISTGKELQNDKNIKIYPNPTNGMVSLEYRSDEAKTLQVRIMNMEGREIFTQSSEKFKGVYTHKLDLSSYTKGIYFVQFISDKNISTKKIVLH